MTEHQGHDLIVRYPAVQNNWATVKDNTVYFDMVAPTYDLVDDEPPQFYCVECEQEATPEQVGLSGAWQIVY